MVPQLDGTYNVSDDSDIDSHSYLDLASSNIIAHRMRGQKQRYETDIRAHTSKRLARKESTKPNTNIKIKGQKVPDDENIDINKIAQGDRPKGGKTKREQLQSWNILSFNPKTTDVDEHIDLINTLGDMVDQTEEAKKEKFIETMPTMIQTHLITCKDWDMVKDTAKSLEHIIMKCDPPTPAMQMMATSVTVLGLYFHIAHSVDKEEGDIPQLFKGAKPKQTRGRGKPKGKPQDQRQNPPKAQEVEENYNYESPNNYYHNTSNQSQGHRPYNGQSRNRPFRGFVP